MSMVVVRLPAAAVRQQEAAVAAIEAGEQVDAKDLQASSASLKALTLAALALPGVMGAPVTHAADDEMTSHYSFYQETDRNNYGMSGQYQPIRVDSLNSTGTMTLKDRIKLGFGYLQDTWSGATPITTARRGFMIDGLSGASSHVNTGTNVLVDKNFNPLKEAYPDGATPTYVTPANGKQWVHMMTSASPETRKQGDAHLTYQWDEASASLGGGVSSERDYDSHFINANASMDFNQKLTTVNAGMSFTDSDINSERVPGTEGYVDYSAKIDPVSGRIVANRKDWSGLWGVSQVLNKNALLSGGFSYTRSTGYLSNPYKNVTFLFKDPNQTHSVYPDDVYVAELINALENRPGERNQFAWDLRYVQYIAPLDAALHVNYRLFNDDWGILAHTLEASWDQPLGHGWSVTPKIRYYSQDAADFYQPMFNFNQLKPKTAAGIDYGKLPIQYFSSDHRLSGYGALSGGLSFSKVFAKGISFDAGVEYYTHSGALKLGGGGEGAYADFDYYLVNAGLRVDLSALSLSGSGQAHHHHHGTVHGSTAPAGVMFDHMLHNAGDFMVGYRYMYGQQAGNMLQGTSMVSDAVLASQACAGQDCSLRPAYMNMHMHMLDLMYAPNDWLNLMLMPQFMDMDMDLATLDGAPPADETGGGHVHSGPRHHATGGIGDTGLYALVGLFDHSGHHVQAGLGFSAPTGSVDQKIHKQSEFIHYGMQLGSGTWDFRPSLTYTGLQDRWFWGAQVNGIVRLQDRNASGFAWGNQVQSSVWGGYRLIDSLQASIRGVHTLQGQIRGQYNGPQDRSGPMDFPANYGGQYWDVGFGLNLALPEGQLAGHRFGVEWLQPVQDQVNGYQLERTGSLYATWNLPF